MAIGYPLDARKIQRIKELAEQGLSTRQIAERMGITRWTVNTHKRVVKEDAPNGKETS
jgi:DNA-binding NarL/FixJ family response regulator